MSNKKVVGSFTLEEYQALSESLQVKPEQYTKPIRIYCDVDGVVMPFINSQEDLDALDGSATVKIVHPQYGREQIDIEEGLFVYNTAVAAKLSEWSHRDDVDFIWLTAWRVNAPYALDELLNVKSVGFLPWSRKMSDYNHAFKKVALREDQEFSPSKFVWLDDFANKRQHAEIPVFTRGEYDYKKVLVPNPETNKVEESWEVDSFVIEDESISPARYLSITTDSYEGLVPEEMDLIDTWLDEESK